MQEGQALILHLIRKDGKLAVCFQPLTSNAPDAPGSNLTPLVITGTPAELEEGFIAAICTPLQERFGMLSNLEEFKKSTQKAQPKADAKEAGTVSVESAATLAPKKTKKEEQMETAEKMAKSGNLPGAYGIYKKLYEQDRSDTKAGNRMHELWAQMSQKTMFPVEPAVTAATEEAPVPQPAVPPVTRIPEAMPPQPAAGEAEEDMFARFLNPGKEEEPAPVPPGFDSARYAEFLRYQEFMKTLPAPATV